MAHAVLGGIVAEASGNGALSGAVGAAGGELAARVIAEQLYPGKKASELSESEKQTVSTLSLLAGSLAAGTAGDSTASAVAGAQGGQNAVENNYLSFDEARAFDKEMTACKASGDDCDAVIRKYDSLNKENREELQQALATDPLVVLSGETKWNVEGGLSAAERPDWLYGSLDNRDVRDYVASNNNYDLNYINSHTTNGDRALAFIGEPENFWGLVAGGKSLFSSSTTMSDKLVGGALSYGANGLVQISSGNTGDKFDLVSFGFSGLTGAATTGKSYYSNQLIGAGSAYATSQITGQDSQAAVMGSMIGTGVGYGIGSAITNKLETQYIKNYFGMEASKNALKYTENSFGPGYLFKGGAMSPIPGMSGGGVGSLMSEAASSAAQKEVQGGDK
ncbi:MULTISPECIES: VENN motif pre-toxin domain-containing protein [unclassified Brenneria]|uniref:VENN motif pre-toxin domain-containing protein n=1 Tax=unclassified Brenneria TaxID=2634434 RepID=UPI002EA1ECE6|nr:VENN motif pre-toxin domain-containing protein [Brenneria sp. L3_3C_1]